MRCDDGCLQMTLRSAGVESLYGQLAASMLLPPTHCALPPPLSFWPQDAPSSLHLVLPAAALQPRPGKWEVKGMTDAQSHIHLSVALGECTARLDRNP